MGRSMPAFNSNAQPAQHHHRRLAAFSSPCSPFPAANLLPPLPPRRDPHLALSCSSSRTGGAMASTSGAEAARPNRVGCTGGVFRRFLCTGFRVHGLHGVRGGIRGVAHGGGGPEGESRRPVASAGPAPGVVARLMGLDTVPPPADRGAATRVAAPYATGRSRSMSCIGGRWPPLAEEPGGPRFHRSSSSREIPTFLRRENEDFLLLTFGRDEEDRDEQMSATKIKRCLLELAEKSRDGGRRGRVVEKNSTEATDNKSEKAIDSEARADSESSSHNSSPVSVLDRASESKADHLIDLQEAPVSDCRRHPSPADHRSRNAPSGREGEQRRRRLKQQEEDPSQRNSRRKHDGRAQLQITRNPTPDVHGPSKSDTVTWSLPTQGSYSGTASTVLPPHRSPGLWVEVRTLASEGVKTTDWAPGDGKNKSKTTPFSEDVGAGVEIQIFDLLLREVVEELSSPPLFFSTREL